MKKLAPLLVLGASVLWGSMGIVTRYVAGLGFHTRQTAAVRIISAALVIVIFLLITDRKKLKINLKDLKWFFGTGIGSLFINNLGYAETVQRASLSVAVVLLYTAPIFVMLMSVVFLKERLTLQKLIALALSLTGCVLVVGLSDANVGDNVYITLFFGLCTGFAYALYTVLGKALVGRYASLTVTAYTFILAACSTFLISEPTSMFQLIGKNLSAMPLVVVGSAITLAMPYLLYSAALQYIESSKASIIASFEVVAASLFGVILYDESLDVFNVIGITCVVAALVLLQLKNFPSKCSSDA